MLWKQICTEINRVKLANDEATGDTEQEDEKQKNKWEQHAANHEKRKMQQMQEQHGGVDLEMIELFEVMDANSSKTVEVSELMESMEDIRNIYGLEHPSTSIDITNVLTRLDSSGDGELDLQEFVMFIEVSTQLTSGVNHSSSELLLACCL